MTQPLKSAKYQLWDVSTSILIFYMIYLSILTFMVILKAFFSDSTEMRFTGSELSSLIFIFVAGLNSFKQIFHFSLANSISRKTFFNGFLLSVLPIAGFMALVDTILSFALSRLLEPYQSFFGVYGSRYMENATGITLTTNLQFLFESFLWSIFLYSFAMMLGFFITTLYYRMNKIAKFIVSFAVPTLVFYLLPILDSLLWNNFLTKNVFSAFLSAVGLKETPQPYIAMLTFLIASAILGGLSFLLIRRATVKQD